MALTDNLSALEQDLDYQSGHFRDFAAARTRASSSDFSFLDECVLEGLLSRVWQAWNSFCRGCFIDSCLGTTNAKGLPVLGLTDAVSEAHVSGAAIIAKKKAAGPFWSTPNTALRSEPTWGDIDLLVTVLNRLTPTNAAQMLAGFSSGHTHAKAIRLIRNAAAHNHSQNMAEVLTLRSSYIVFPITHPVHALFWTAPSSSDFLVMDAINGLKTAAVTTIS